MAAAHPYCGGHHCITANHTCPTLGAEATEAYEDDHALIMVSSNIEPKVQFVISLLEITSELMTIAFLGGQPGG